MTAFKKREKLSVITNNNNNNNNNNDDDDDSNRHLYSTNFYMNIFSCEYIQFKSEQGCP